MLSRLIRFYNHAWIWWLLVLPGILVFLSWRFGTNRAMLVWLWDGSIVLFCVPWLARYHLTRHYFAWRHWSNRGFLLAMLGLLVLRFTGHTAIAVIACGWYYSLYVGCLFWTVTDDLFDIFSWLSHPLEFARPPDEIYFLDQQRHEGTLLRLWRFRYDDDWGIGVTGLSTFSFNEKDLESTEPEAVYRHYLKWYNDPKLTKMRDDAVQELIDGWFKSDDTDE